MVVAQKVPGRYEEELNDLDEGEGWGGKAAFSQTEMLAEAPVSLLSSPRSEAAGYVSLHQPGPHCSPRPANPGDPALQTRRC